MATRERKPKKEKGTRASPQRKRSPAAGRSPSLLQPLPPSEIQGLLDDVKATTIALLASLQDKEGELVRRSSDAAAPGVRRGLSDIRTLRRWADRVLRTIEVLERGRSGELERLLAELEEFREILHERQPPIADRPMILPASRS